MPTLTQLAANIKATKETTNVIIVIGLSLELADLYNKSILEENSKLVFQTINDEEKNVHVIFNKSPCPRLHVVDSSQIGHIFSGSIVVLVEYNDNTYTIFVKDKNRPLASLPGGTANVDEIKNGHCDHEKIGIRETYEETTGVIMVDGKEQHVDGISLNSYNLIQILKVDYNASIFGVNNVPDTNETFMAQIQFQSNSNSVLNYLFKECNKIDNYYSLSFVNHPEISHILAMPLNITKKINIDDLFLAKNMNITSSLSWFASQFAYCCINGLLPPNQSFYFNDRQKLRNCKFPQNILSLETYT